MPKNQIKKFENAIKTIMANPAIGTAKYGDLQGVQVYKYTNIQLETTLFYLHMK